jgi:O-antigen/teichoic acid export membrane protein
MILEEIFHLFTKERASHKERDFFMNIFRVGSSLSYTAVLGMATTIIAGRMLGPSNFGLYSIIIGIGQIIMIPMTLGVPTALAQLIPQSNNPKKLIADSIPPTVITLSVCTITILLLQHVFIRWLNISSIVIILAICVGVSVSLRSFIDGILRGKKLFSLSPRIEIVASTLSFALVCIAILIGHFTITTYVVIGIASFLTYGLYGAWNVRSYLGWSTGKESLHVIQYGFFTFIISLLLTTLWQSDRIVLQSMYGQSIVGLYSAHVLIPLFLAPFFASIINYVLHPTSSTITNFKSLYKKTRLFCVPLMVVLFFMSYVGEVILFLLLGDKYQIHYVWILLSSIYGSLFFYATVLSILVQSRGLRAVQLLAKNVLVSFILYAVLIAVFSRSFGGTGVLISLIITYVILIMLLSRLIKSFFEVV